MLFFSVRVTLHLPYVCVLALYLCVLAVTTAQEEGEDTGVVCECRGTLTFAVCVCVTGMSVCFSGDQCPGGERGVVCECQG